MDLNTIKKIAYLSRLELSAQEAELYAGHLTQILNYVDQLKEVDTQDVKEFKIAFLQKPSFRQDGDLPTEEGKKPSLPGEHRQKFLANAPQVAQKCVVVQKVIDQG